MLSRVASHLYWLSRYLERAENMARILDVGQSLALLSGSDGDEQSALEPLVLTDTLQAFRATGEAVTPDNIARFLAWSPTLPSSIVNCLESSRENARAVRGSITSEMWENINDTWLQLAKRRAERPIGAEFFEWVKERSHLFRGVTFATIRRDQPYHFIRLATYIERADNTARILSVKQAKADDDGEAGVDVVTDYYRLSAVLRSVSSLEAYRDTYRDAIEARRVAELLIFSPQLPRSLRFCFDEIDRILDALPEQAGKQARRIAATIHASLRFGEVDEIYQTGLDNFLENFLKDNNRLGTAVHSAYLELK
ncbi:MAG TPA: alpha-E domain-containing protein [Burkholderiaceae bacterium]|nr:alpha-E domain-containing protein [Burkholderiaceae bacterium]